MQHRRFHDLPRDTPGGGAHVIDGEKSGRLLGNCGAVLLLAHGRCPTARGQSAQSRKNAGWLRA
jgi:hypothetical protein